MINNVHTQRYMIVSRVNTNRQTAEMYTIKASCCIGRPGHNDLIHHQIIANLTVILMTTGWISEEAVNVLFGRVQAMCYHYNDLLLTTFPTGSGYFNSNLSFMLWATGNSMKCFSAFGLPIMPAREKGMGMFATGYQKYDFITMLCGDFCDDNELPYSEGISCSLCPLRVRTGEWSPSFTPYGRHSLHLDLPESGYSRVRSEHYCMLRAFV